LTTITVLGSCVPQAKVRSTLAPGGCSSGATNLTAALVSTVIEPAVTGSPSSSTTQGKASTSVLSAAAVPVQPITTMPGVASALTLTALVNGRAQVRPHRQPMNWPPTMERPPSAREPSRKRTGTG